MPESFKALVLDQQDGRTTHAIRELTVADLPEGEVLVAVSHSTLNYKDGLAITGTGKIVRKFPMVPGVDFAGVVEQSTSPDFRPGDAVLLNGWGVGERHWGGHAGKARVQAAWLTPMPQGLTAAQAMAVGTAGYTAMLCVMALEAHGVKAQDGPVLVTGAAGGVGSVAVAVLAGLGFEVVASTGREQTHDYLRGLGASRMVARDELARDAKPLEAETWAAAVDTVGSKTLATVLAQTRYGGAVAACGLAGGADLPTSVFPFILRGVALLGVDSVMLPQARRKLAWERVVRDLPLDRLAALSETVTLADLPARAADIVAGRVRGRLVVEIGA